MYQIIGTAFCYLLNNVNAISSVVSTAIRLSKQLHKHCATGLCQLFSGNLTFFQHKSDVASIQCTTDNCINFITVWPTPKKCSIRPLGSPSLQSRIEFEAQTELNITVRCFREARTQWVVVVGKYSNKLIFKYFSAYSGVQMRCQPPACRAV